MFLTLFMIALLTFCLMHIVPGSPFTSQKQVSQAVLDALNAIIIPIRLLYTVTGILLRKSAIQAQFS